MTHIALVTGPVQYSNEQQAVCCRVYRCLYGRRYGHTPGHVVETNFNKESAFKVTVKLVQANSPLELILCSSTHILEAEALFENIKAPALFESVHRTLDNGSIQIPPNEYVVQPIARVRTLLQTSLRVLMLTCSASYATSTLLADFTRRTGIPVTIDTIHRYDDLYDDVIRAAWADTYDVLHIDLPWFAELASTGCLADLTDAIQANPDVIQDDIPGVLDAYTKYDGCYFGLP